MLTNFPLWEILALVYTVAALLPRNSPRNGLAHGSISMWAEWENSREYSPNIDEGLAFQASVRDRDQSCSVFRARRQCVSISSAGRPQNTLDTWEKWAYYTGVGVMLGLGVEQCDYEESGATRLQQSINNDSHCSELRAMWTDSDLCRIPVGWGVIVEADSAKRMLCIQEEEVRLTKRQHSVYSAVSLWGRVREKSIVGRCIARKWSLWLEVIRCCG